MVELSEEQVRAIVGRVIDNHGVSIDEDQRSRIELELRWIASARDNFERDTKREAQEEHSARLERVAALDRVVKLYDELRERSENHQTNDLRALASGRKDVTRALPDLRALLEAERDLANQSQPSPIPNQRPTSSKHLGGRDIYTVLREADMTPGKATNLITDLFIESGIEEPPVDTDKRRKIQRALYDRFHRP